MKSDTPAEEGRVGILTYALKRESGESRQALNFALGLKRRGLAPTIFTIAASPDVRAACKAMDITVRFQQSSLGQIDSLGLMLYSDRLASRLAELVRSDDPCHDYLVVQDAAIPSVAQHLPGRTTYFCCGDMLLLLLHRMFRKTRALAPYLLSFDFVRALDRHAELVNQFDRVVANSQFTKGLMSYLYNCPVSGVVYPPVDTEKFSPMLTEPDHTPYAIAVLRDTAEPAYPTVARLAARNRVRIIGRGRVPDALSLGPLSDPELVEQYSKAQVVVSPSFRELFGYPIVEAMACGTPAIAFAQGAACEIINDGIDGWLATDEDEFIATAEDKLNSGFPKTVRQRCRETALKFSIDASSAALIRQMGL